MRNSVKRALIAAVLVLTAACSGGGPTSSGAPKIGFSLATTDADFAQEMAAGGQFAADAVGGVDLQISAPNSVDPPAQVKLFGDLGRTAPDGIAIEDLAPELFVRPLADLAARKIRLVGVDTVPAPGSNVGLYVGNDNRGAGKQLALEAIKLLPPDATGDVVLGTPNPGVPVLDERANGMKEAFAEKLPGVKVLGPFETKNDPAANFEIWNGLVKAHPKALAFLGTGDQDAYNLAKAKQTAGGSYLVAAFDLDPKTLAAVKDGTSFAAMSPEHYFKGYVAIRMLAEAAKAGKALPEGWADPGHLLVTKANVDEITARQASDQAKRAWLKSRADEFFSGIQGRLRPLSEAK
ncbi:sugar ABC transporter substrate-binding protein [Nonomuraea sp. NPDC050547]|uniref:sugar ABC transporter substrate-binding protein n=1 Tax=unclassified Nonomuraea TaxID=2593643 RepID=UPI00378E3F96